MACSRSSVVLVALQDVFDDFDFTTGSKEGSDAIEAARQLKEWCVSESNVADFNESTDSEVQDYLLKMIVQLFVTVRGFAYTSSWIELYKQMARKST